LLASNLTQKGTGMSLPPTSAEEAALARVNAEHDLRKTVDRAAGLHNELRTAGDRWRAFLQERHEQITERWPAIRDAVVDARRWENPINFNGTFAEKVMRATPLPAISSVGQMERLICRAVVMLDLSPAEREALIAEAYESELAARRVSAKAAANEKISAEEIDISSIKFEL
jgi:hypothetical protein